MTPKHPFNTKRLTVFLRDQDVETIDKLISDLPGIVSRNTWIAIAIREKIERDNKKEVN